MLVSRIPVIVSLLFFIQDVTGIGEENTVSDGAYYPGASSGNGQSGSTRNCGDVYKNHSDCSFHHVLERKC